MRSPLRVRFVRDVALTGGAQVLQAGCAMLAGVLIARFLGPAPKGELAVLAALGSMAVLLASLGVHQSGIYFLGLFKDRADTVISNIAAFASFGGIATGACL